MTHRQFTDTMQILFQVWDGTDNAQEILTDVCNTFASRVYGLDSEGRRRFRQICMGIEEEA